MDLSSRLRKQVHRAPCLFVVLFAIAAEPPSVRAEFTVGAELPAFSLKTADGQVVELRRDDKTVAVQLGDERIQPKALIIHLLQPDCLQCRAQLQALEPIAQRYRERGVVTLGIAHRGTPEAARELSESLSLPFPIAVGVDSAVARQFAAGDTLGITDAKGIIRFAQVGFGEGDEKLWQKALDELLAGESVTTSGVDRDRLAVGDVLPAIRLPSLRTGKRMALIGESGRLVFRDDAGSETRPKVAVGFFSRY